MVFIIIFFLHFAGVTNNSGRVVEYHLHTELLILRVPLVY